MSDIENETEQHETEPVETEAETEAPAAEAETVEEGTPAEPEAAVEPEAAAEPEPEPEAPAEEAAVAEAPAAEAPPPKSLPPEEAGGRSPLPSPPPRSLPPSRSACRRSACSGAACAGTGAQALRKHVPRSARRTRTKVQRERPKTRKPIVRLEKPEHERGRRQERRGVVVSDAMDKTIVVKVESIRAHQRYKKVIRRSVKFHAHDEQNQAHVGDRVRIVETKPLSKTKRWRLAEILEVAK